MYDETLNSRHQLDKHVKVHAKELKNYPPKHASEGQKTASQETSNFRNELCGVDDPRSPKNCEDFELEQNQVKLELFPISPFNDDDQEEIMENTGNENEQYFVIKDIIVIEEVKIETRPDDNEEFSINNIIQTTNEAYETKAIDKNGSNSKNISTSRNGLQVDDTISDVQTIFNLNNSVDQNVLTENNRNRYTCLKCDRKFNRLCQLTNHMDNHNITEKSTNMNDELLSTTKEVDLDYRTPGPDVFKQFDEVKRNTIVGEFQCDICQKVISDKRKLKDHKRFHKPKDHVCSICERPF